MCVGGGLDGVGTENWYYGDVSCCDQQYVYVVCYYGLVLC